MVSIESLHQCLPWRGKADRLLEEEKALMKRRSLQLGISLRFVLEELRPLYDEKAKHAEWRLDQFGPVTCSGFQVKVRNCGLSGVSWQDLPACDSPADPNFHQVASLLAYGPHALGKGLICPRDGLPDCSIVDALHDQNKSAKATWFLSWIWNYKLDKVLKALSSWWQRVRAKMGENGWQADAYVWWCVFVHNQFRILEAGVVEEQGDLFNVFGQQLKDIGAMIICLDSLDESQYTRRIWCIFEVFVAVQRQIPMTLAFDPRDLAYIDTQVSSLQDIFDLCTVNSQRARASVEADAVAIKEHIMQTHGSFQFVNETVEQLLVTEVLQHLKLNDKARQVAVQSDRGDSRYFGVSLGFVLGEFKCLYKKKSPEAEWRVHDHCKVTQSGFKVKVRDCCDLESGVLAWDDLAVCNPPDNPNFYQLAGLLAYGPHALGKGQTCPRDGLPDCSLVDALREQNKSAPANWFLSWAWAYTLNDVWGALARWWDTHVLTVASPSDGSMSIYLWWCFFVNNQFRMLEDGITQDTDSLLKVFAEPLERTGKVLMCMDKFQNCTYTNRIWCIFEIFSALRRNIPVTLIMPELQMDQEIKTLTELMDACRVDVKKATASIKADEEKIKMQIKKEMKSFKYVSQTVEQALWIEVMKKFNARKAKESLRNSSSSLNVDQQQNGCMVS